MLNNTELQRQIWPGLLERPRASGVGSKKSTQQGHSHFCARSVHAVREHGKIGENAADGFFHQTPEGKVDMRLYESLCILRPVPVESDNDRVIEKMKEVLNHAGANIMKLENSGKKKLAYDIQHERKGNFITVQFEGPSTAVAELERFQRMEDQVMKFMTVRINPSEVVAETETGGEDSGRWWDSIKLF